MLQMFWSREVEDNSSDKEFTGIGKSWTRTPRRNPAKGGGTGEIPLERMG